MGIFLFFPTFPCFWKVDPGSAILRRQEKLEKTDDKIRVIFLGGSHIFDLNYYDYEGGDFTKQIMKSIIKKHNWYSRRKVKVE